MLAASSGGGRLGVGGDDKVDEAFATRREDVKQSVDLTLSHHRFFWEGDQPVFMLDWSLTESNLALHDQKLLRFRVGQRRLF